MRPGRRAGHKALQARRNFEDLEIALQHEVQTHQVNAHGFVRMLAARVLHSVGVHGQLMDLCEQDGVLVFDSEHLRITSPALGRGVVVTAIGMRAGGEFDSTSGAAALGSFHGRRC